MFKDVEHLFMYLVTICTFPFGGGDMSLHPLPVFYLDHDEFIISIESYEFLVYFGFYVFRSD